MKINFNVDLKNLEGETLENNGKKITLKGIACDSLLAGFPDESNLSGEEKAKRYELAKEITTPDGFINTSDQPIKIADYIGKKVILICLHRNR